MNARAPEPCLGRAPCADDEARHRADHIAIVLHDFSAGGSERIAITLGNRWAQCGRRITLLCGSASGPSRARVAAEVCVQVVQPEIGRGRGSRRRLAQALLQVLEPLQPDVVFAPGNFHLPVIGVMARRLHGTAPTWVGKISNLLRQPGRPRWRQALFAAIARYRCTPLDCLVAMSPALRDEAARVLRRDDLEYVHEPNLALDAASPMPTKPEVPLMVCAGRLVAQKRFALALRALAALGPDSPVRLLMLGDGPERDELQTLARRLGIAARVQWAGHVPDIAPALANASALLLTSRYEGYPAVLIEALAAGVPVLTTDCSPALPEILFDASFGRIAAAEPQALAQALHQTMALQPRAEAVAMLVQRHRAQSCADSYLALLDRAVAAKHRLQLPTPPCRA